MKRNVLFGIAIMAIAMVVAWNVNFSSIERGLSDISLKNIEVLASSENPWQLDAMECYYAGCRIQYGFDCHVYKYGLYWGVCQFMWGL